MKLPFYFHEGEAENGEELDVTKELVAGQSDHDGRCGT